MKKENMKKVSIVMERKGYDGHTYTKFSNGAIGHVDCPCLKKGKKKEKIYVCDHCPAEW